MCKLLNMGTFRKVWLVMALLLCFKNTGCKPQGFCKNARPVVNVCTADSSISSQSVYIDTVSVPQFVIITCKCVISTSAINETFVFKYTDNTDHTWFKLDEQYLNETYVADINNEADLIFFTTDDATSATGCLNVSTENRVSFNITCFQKTTDNTTDPVRPWTSYSSSGIKSVKESKVEQDEKTESETDVIAVPVVAATAASVVCIAGVVALIVVCRRRSLADKQTSKTSTTVVEKEKEDEYYMTENPMYNVTDVEPNIQSAEREYHYIETENQGGSMPYCHYDIIRDSLVTGEISEKKDDLHYDYTTCTSTRAKSGPELADKVDENKSQNKTVLEQESKLTADDTMYDRTDRAATKHFQSVNDYHHISPAASRKRVAIDTYNTCGEAKCQNAHIKK